MNIMDKEEFLKIYNKFLTQSASNQDAKKLIENYCIKMGKDSKESAIFAKHLIEMGIPINYNKMLDYFAKEFNIIEIYNQQNQLIKILN